MYAKPAGREVLQNEEVCLIRYKKVPGDTQKNWVESDFYHICLPDKHFLLGYKVAGYCDLRFGYNRQLYFGGNIGYRVEEPFRGHHLAEKATRLLFEKAKEAGMPYVIITCNPDNLPSRRTLERLGGDLLEIVDLPPDNDMYQRGERQKCIFHYPLQEGAVRMLLADSEHESFPEPELFVPRAE